MQSYLVGFSAAVLCGLMLTACPGSLDDPERFSNGSGNGNGDSGTAACQTEAMLVAKCGGAGCHAANATAPDLASPGIAARIIGQSAKVCQGPLADPQNPDTSLMITKLKPSPTCGARMPTTLPLSDAEIACVRKWIANGGKD